MIKLFSSRLKFFITLLTLIHCWGNFSFGQNIDSLLKILPSQKDTQKVIVLDQISTYYANRENEKSLEFALKALKEAERLKIKKFIAEENILVGNAYTSLGNYSKAIGYALNAYKMYDELKLYRKAARASNVLGNLYLGQQNYLKSKEYYTNVLNIGKKTDNVYVRSLGYLGISSVYTEQYQLDSALVYLELAEKGFKAAKRDYEHLAVVINKGSVLQDMQRYEEAYTTFLSVIDEVKAINDSYFESTLYSNIGGTLKGMKKYNEALVYYRKAIAITEKLKNLDNQKNIYLNFAEIFSSMRESDSAYAYLKKYVTIKDSLFKIENVKMMNELEGKYQLDKKNAEIAAKNAIIKSKDAEGKLKDAENHKKSLILWFLIGGLAITLGLFVLVYRNYILRKKAYREITQQKQIIEAKNNEILDSIQYAKRIQSTLLASEGILNDNLKEHFILYQPKDIVSGDFYWATEVFDASGNKNFMLCTADCTGHGVPGAFMSLLCISFLNEITRDRKLVPPADIFKRLKKEIVASLNPDKAIHTRDGMDAVLCSFDFTNRKMLLAAANNPVLIVRNNTLIEIKPDKNPIGKYEETGYDYTNHTISLEPNDIVYTLTDGYADQFGGTTAEYSNGKKFKYKRLKEMLLKNSGLPLTQQRALLEENLKKWKGDLEQLDDILIIGIKIS